jgi:hypothetical protein
MMRGALQPLPAVENDRTEPISHRYSTMQAPPWVACLCSAVQESGGTTTPSGKLGRTGAAERIKSAIAAEPTTSPAKEMSFHPNP